jgi:hypothetical protein
MARYKISFVTKDNNHNRLIPELPIQKYPKDADFITAFKKKK